MSFASGIKSELLRIDNKKECCTAAEISGIMCFGGTIYKEAETLCLKISTENTATARRCFSLMKQFFGLSGTLSQNHSRAGGGNAYGITVCGTEEVCRVLEATGQRGEGDTLLRRVPQAYFESACCRRAFLRGAFLGGGSVTNPEKEYHLEYSTPSPALAADVEALFAEFDIGAKTVQRKTSYVVYFKNSEEIGDILNIIGAHKSYMELMNVRILKETRNRVNRKINCETANMDKAIDAAMEQIRAITCLEKSGRLETLLPALQETARARTENPEATMTELGNMLGVSKSGINHRMRRLMEMAEKCSQKDEE